MNDFQECRSYEMDDGVYAVNWGGVYAIAHAYAWANARLRISQDDGRSFHGMTAGRFTG